MRRLVRYLSYLAVLASLTFSHSLRAQSFEELLRAVEADDASTVSALLSKGLDPNTTDAEGNTLLMLAARQGYADLVKVLIGWKASPVRRNPYGDTPLMAACLGGYLDAAKLLVAAGAPVNGPGWTPLHYAAYEGHADVVEYLLGVGANKDALAPNGYSALMLAVRNRQHAATRALLQWKPDLTIEGPRGETALSIATQRGERELADLLRRAGAVR
jgi:ankyrin repeat protein